MSQDINNGNVQPDLFESGESSASKEIHAKSATMFCDGASSGNPGKSGIGVLISFNDTGLSDESRTCRLSEYIGNATNNVAEYSALIRGLEKARSLGVRTIDIYLDSELLVKQMNGIYKVKNKNLYRLWTRAKKLSNEFESCKITHVRREMNTEADALASQAVKKGR
jgi:ribonuclease HI